ncbi:bone morphogenetic protein 4 isoform X1 [Salvelinus sp. IW2-2015]|uniref:bone morphogenetic protein 4 isoform X1 n=1 Tax=Salvelinus sp. IW2-2015 TaxID=2691554 RepID=UPI0038D4E99D
MSKRLQFFLTTVIMYDLRPDDLEGAIEENKELGKAILEMLHINKLSAPHVAKPHPYMRQVYQLLDTQEARDLGSSDGTLVQSFRSVLGPPHAPAGWIWFNVSHLKPSMAVAELVLLRKTLHPDPLSVTVALHSLTRGASGLSVSPPLEERILTLDQLPPSGYDVFDVSPFMFSSMPLDVVGFQLRYTDESGSLVLHEALTQSLYCLGGGSLSEPLLVVYRARPLRPQTTAATNGFRPERRQRQHCSTRSHERRSLFLAKRNGYKRRRFDASSDPQCRLYHRYVDFNKGDLANWILQPSGFNATFCRGTCHIGNSEVSIEGFRARKMSPEERSVNSSNCVPLELSSLTVMYRSETDDVIIQKFRDARAESCTCQRQAKH